MPLWQKADLDDVQNRAIDYLYEHDRALALCPTGAGKTVMAMTALQELMADGHIKRPLVFAPIRVAQLVWPYEGEDWEHLQDFDMVPMGGAPKNWHDDNILKESRLLWGQRLAATHAVDRMPEGTDRRRKMDAYESLVEQERVLNRRIRNRLALPARLHVTSYENLEWLLNLYKPGQLPFDALVFDEIGKLKNPKSPRSKLARKHTIKMPVTDPIWGLNATPAPEGHEDLYMQVAIVDGGKLWGRSFYRWRLKYFMPVDYRGYKWAPQPTAKEKIIEDLNTVSFKIDSADLPYKKNMRVTPVPVELPPDARELYDEMEASFGVSLEDTGDIVAFSEGAKAMKLRQITQGFIYDEDGKGHILHQEKEHALSDLLDAMNGEPVLIAYDFREDLEAIRRVFKNIPYLGAGVSDRQAKENVDLWNNRKLSAMAVHPYSASHGLNLQKGGSNVIWFYIPWPQEAYQQLNERVDRRGQTQACFAHMIAAKSSVEDRITVRLRGKGATQEEIIAAVKSI